LKESLQVPGRTGSRGGATQVHIEFMDDTSRTIIQNVKALFVKNKSSAGEHEAPCVSYVVYAHILGSFSLVGLLSPHCAL
ncbi:hypothetical protein C8F04DRAFT_960769, partial [Mycena alexandri]